ncbi:DUF6528 family protein [Actinoplanes couchii]|uniref:Uncharacterized protein n=1 Tax=Actinoplanes couchii TaxID=403638 RepID=A0ABQ3XEH3_9ACTN|nr:DUF6528 family protein [Actinoplanes couchii]MDR6319781.1 hypothetical protein [Actinoplanes couchii]GID56916.1 hypothetical protein Aco03nite_053200 [Actinoplanes couchii]
MNKRGTGAVLAALVISMTSALAVPSAAVAAVADFPVLAGDQKTDKIYRLSTSTYTWDSWTWAPTTDLGYTTGEGEGFNGGNDFRVRNTTAGQRLVVADGPGLVTVATYPEGKRVWATKATSGDNLHSAELLPDGNVAVAATGTGEVRIYPTSSAAKPASFPLPAAHSVLWDPGIRRLWVTGSPTDGTAKEQVLMALEVTGPASTPGLRVDTTRTLKISTGTDDVHDVAADHTDPNKLWITTNSRVYAYDKTTKQLTSAGTGVDRQAVKSISLQPSGQIVQTQADKYRTPPVDCGTPVNGYCTATLDFFNPAKSVTKAGAEFYKARVASPYYGVEDIAQRGRVFDSAGGTTVEVGETATVGRIAATIDKDGRQHVLTLIPGEGLWSRTRDADGVWQATEKRDNSLRITDVTVTADAAGNLHAFTLIPDLGVWYRKRPASQPWNATSSQVDSSTDLRSIAAVAHPTGKLHLILAGSTGGVRERTATAAGVWSSTVTTVDNNKEIADLAAAALPNGSLHLFTVTLWGGVYHRAGSDTTWPVASTLVPGGTESPATGQVRALAAAGWPSAQLDLVTLRSGIGLWNQTWTGSSWPTPVRTDTSTGSLQVYAVRGTDGVLHTGKISEIS